MSRRTNSSTHPVVSVGEAASLPTGNGADAVASPVFAKRAPRIQGESFPASMPVGQFLFEYLYRRAFATVSEFQAISLCRHLHG